MDSTDGTVKVLEQFDRDAASAILVFNQLTLTVTDSAGQTDTASLIVTLDDINDNTPQCTSSIHNVNLVENSAVGMLYESVVNHFNWEIAYISKAYSRDKGSLSEFYQSCLLVLPIHAAK